MPRRSKTRASNPHTSVTTSPPPPQHDSQSENLVLLRRQWRWAAFSQFFYTFSPLFAMGDITISDIETDLVYQTNNTLSRIMQKLLYTLSYDRKVSLDNWQSALRKQYNKRNPQANPIGPDPKDTKRHPNDCKEQEISISEPPDQALEEPQGNTDGEQTNLSSREGSRSDETGPCDLRLGEGVELSRQSSVAQNFHVAESRRRIDEDPDQEESVDWFDLPMMTKLESMHTLAEWQFQNPTRLRTIMKSDDEFASWRIEPTGYDSKRNAYWLIGGDRLWIQRIPPKTPKSQSLKRKRTTNQVPEKPQPHSKLTTSSKRPRLEQGDLSSSAQNTSGRQSRVAKDQAKLKLDLQARELAKLNREASMLGRSPKPPHASSSRTQPSKRVVGTRTSARLRGSAEDEWQPIPDEWLDSNAKGGTPKTSVLRTGLESDQETVSDLTELSEEVEEGTDAKLQTSESLANVYDQSSRCHLEENDSKQAHEALENFVEWETICVSLREWEQVTEQLEKATHYAEKALYKILVNDIVPAITQELREIERKREIEEALVHRKRSSRIALKESEREEARLAVKRKQEEEEKFSRSRRMEARLQKEETERIKRETAREQRRKEREAREESRKASVEKEKPVDTPTKPSKADQGILSMDDTLEEKANGKTGTNSGSRTPAGEDWELSCEVCQRYGLNLDDGTPMMSCGRCSKWQHILCHDRADKAAGLPPRNWVSVDFICKTCRNKRQDPRQDRFFPPSRHLPALSSSQMQSYQSYPQAMVPSVDLHPSAYLPTYREPAQQSYYVRPANGQLNNAGQYTVPVATNGPRPTISFSHYQPAAHGFSSGAQKVYPDHQSYYGEPLRTATSPPYKPPTTIPAWNITTPAHAPGYSLLPNGGAAASSSNIYRSQSDERQGVVSINESQSLHRYSEQHYPSTQFKHHPTSYQPPLGR
ncbi:hypothetical protein GALMADRAFT_244816 [Galerina marginata CBS 339.88]|uniref:Zinc finger PHD-type domain-containing protein n=1 Tax=Galerina marginata (strain CBS 339.88) TaxID=685588 RepID=A0A067TJC2_GALM3|nr:hypothetical protein GALMADRAFT_244816 [Galerina marginata CBS 339.88]